MIKEEYTTKVVNGFLCKVYDNGTYGTLEWDYKENKMTTKIHNDIEELKRYLEETKGGF